MRIVLLLFVLGSSLLYSQQEVTTKDIATGLDTPWEILWGPDDHIWMTERYGRISRVNPGTGEVNELLRLDEVFEDGERGLMGMVLHPDFDNNPHLYTVFTYRGNGGETLIKLIRLTYDGVSLIEPSTILDSIKGAWNHDGSRLLIDDDMTLYMTMGDAAVPNLSQDLNSLNGKVLRMNLDGTVPEDNPIPNSYIWSWGHRNPQGLVKANGILYSSEHGPATDDELNIIIPNRNFGWPTVNGFCDKPSEMDFCEANDVVEPIAAWTPTLAVAGIDYYKHNYISEWNNSILLVALKASRLVQMPLSEDGKTVLEENHYFVGEFGRLRDVCVSPTGRVFISTSNKDGRGAPAQQDDRIIEIMPLGTDVNENKGSDIKLYPNPMNDNLQIEGLGHGKSNIRITNLLGKEVVNQDIKSSSMKWNGRNRYGEKLPFGIYIVNIENGKKVITKTVLLKN